MKADHHKVDLSINPALVAEILVRFIRNEVTRTGFTRGVFGLSGGIDSSTVAYLAVKALGAENVQAVTMPDAAGQQVRPRANDRALRSKRGLRGPGDRHQQ